MASSCDETLNENRVFEIDAGIDDDFARCTWDDEATFVSGIRDAATPH